MVMSGGTGGGRSGDGASPKYGCFVIIMVIIITMIKDVSIHLRACVYVDIQVPCMYVGRYMHVMCRQPVLGWRYVP